MSTDLIERTNIRLAETGSSPFEAFAQQAATNRILGDIIRLDKGEWLAGQNGDEVPDGTRAVAVMDELLWGWVKWQGGKPVDRQMGRFADGYRPPLRDALGDFDEGRWEKRKDGTPKDPWEETLTLILQRDDGRYYTYSPSAKTGRMCVRDLMSEYGRHLRVSREEYPIVELTTRVYRNDHGKQYAPVLRVAGWTPRAPVLADLGSATVEQGATADDNDEIPF